MFESYVVGLYSKRLQTYSGERIEVLGDNTIDDRDTQVTSLILRDNGPPVSVGWRVRTAGGNARIIDVTIEGVSMAIVVRRADPASGECVLARHPSPDPDPLTAATIRGVTRSGRSYWAQWPAPGITSNRRQCGSEAKSARRSSR